MSSLKELLLSNNINPDDIIAIVEESIEIEKTIMYAHKALNNYVEYMSMEEKITRYEVFLLRLRRHLGT